MELLSKSTIENCWLSACFQLLLETNYLDKGKGEFNRARNIRSMFYHYNYQGDNRNCKTEKMYKFLKNFSDVYILGSIKEPKLRILKLEDKYLEYLIRPGDTSTTVLKST